MAEIALNDGDATREKPPTEASRLCFGSFVLDLQRAELLRDGIAVPLRPKAFALLSLLAQRAGRVLPKQEILDAIWPGIIVTEDSLTQCVHELRTALGEHGAELVRTVPRRGYRFDGEVRPDTSNARQPTAAHVAPATMRRDRLVAWLGGALTLTLLAALGGFAVLRASSPDAAYSAPPLSIVVLPLVNAGGESDWFSDALSNDLTTELGQVWGSFVISRETAFTYRGKAADPRVVARELGVRYVVQGNVRRDGERVRMDLSMVDGASGALHWSQQTESDRAQLAASLEGIARQVARSLSVQMYRSSGERITALEPGQVQADDMAMQGWAVWFRGFTPENLREAGRLFEAAVDRDPPSIRGWGGVAVVNGVGGAINWLPDKSAAMARLQQASDRLQVLDGDSLFAWLARSNIANLKDDYEGWLLLVTAMAERFPSHPQPHFTRGLALMNLGRLEECVEPAKRALRLGPRDTFAGLWNWQIGTCHFMRGEYREAVQFARAAQQAGPRLPLPPLLLAASLAREGNTEEARRVVADFMARNPDYKTSQIELLMRSRHTRYVEGRERLIATLRELGMQ
jgi:DNA-binding winged helix-turn-helix (wHTH) protein/TolB-like protein